jgi:hypothetical protein
MTYRRGTIGTRGEFVRTLAKVLEMPPPRAELSRMEKAGRRRVQRADRAWLKKIRPADSSARRGR